MEERKDPLSKETPQEPASSRSSAKSSTEGGNVPNTSKDHSTPTTIPQAPVDRPWSSRLSSGGWRGKAAAIAEIARESIPANATSSEVGSDGETPTRSAKRLSRTLQTSIKSSPIAASMTKLHVTSNNSEESSTKEETKNPADARNPVIEDKQASVPGELQGTDGLNEMVAKESLVPTPLWRGWLLRSSEPDAEEKATDGLPTHQQERAPAKQGGSGQRRDSDKAEAPDAPNQSDQTQQSGSDSKPIESRAETKKDSRSSWFGLLGTGYPFLRGDDGSQATPKADSAQPSHSPISAVPETANTSSAQQDSQPPDLQPTRQASGSWIFWSREKSAAETKTQKNGAPKEEVGELAVAHKASQSQPEPVKLQEEDMTQTSLTDSKTKKRERPMSSEQPVQGSSKRAATVKDEPDTRGPAETYAQQDLALKSAGERLAKAQAARRVQAMNKYLGNILLPEIHNTYKVAPVPSYWQQLSRIMGPGQASSRKHLSLSPSTPKLHKALAIGVHGYFPAPLIQKVLGPPTGTSIRFADGAAEAIRKWASSHGHLCTIEKAALEGEGMVSNRVDVLWKLLLNWIDSIRKADFILVACHSQGVPVAVSLVARLIDFGCVTHARIGICGMAGINLGPFPSYQSQSRFFGGSTTELFEFSRHNSLVSESYTAALRLVLKHQVRILYVGAIDDQLVSLESATFSNISHPYVYRAVWVDGSIHAPDFLCHLVGFALKLRNLGFSDHGLVRELSEPLAGSLYTGQGHSRIYEDQGIYDLAVEHTLETANMDSRENPELEVGSFEVPSSTTHNPYFLPWSMRGILEEEYVRKEMKGETQALLGMFEKWKPQSKVLKDVRFRLEAVKSKL